ncbi:hypothetical protein BSKO_03859 [Bryopsis sp. KO-2023]|nr:hypothetical protein BSKO_03859 [Bryopsis sp. KO-2023]
MYSKDSLLGSFQPNGGEDGAPILPSDSKYFHHISRELAKERHQLYNRMCSILEDVEFVDAVRVLYGGLPVLANLRCGAWYAPTRDDCCYFKSTDGHHGNWSFSLVRLNLNVVEWCAAKGGCLIVDATRKGKKFPDAMNKTIPIWAAVINRAAARLDPRRKRMSEWDTSLHFPIWVTDSETNQVEERLDGWVDSLLALGTDLENLLQKLDKPLRPLWISPSSTLTHDMDTSQLHFSPIVLVSASKQDAGARRNSSCPGVQGWPYVYVPGAGDDEESWALGLKPTILWAHHQDLVECGPHNIESRVSHLVEESHSNGITTQGSRLPGLCVATDSHHLVPKGCSSVGNHPHMQEHGFFWIGRSNLALGNFEAGRPLGIWSHVDAVLNCGSKEHESLKMERVPSGEENNDAHGELPGRYMWCPIDCSKRDKAALKRKLPAVLEFLSSKLDAGCRVLVHDDEGSDACVCITVAVLLMCFSEKSNTEEAGGSSDLRFCQKFGEFDEVSIATARKVTKDAVRRRLGFVTSWYSDGRPTRGMLKQVFNFFFEMGRTGSTSPTCEKEK